MTIDTILIKASYDLHDKQDSFDHTIAKRAEDIREGRTTQSYKLMRHLDDIDLLKFNFLLTGRVSITDPLIISAALSGRAVYVVGNEETRRHVEAIQTVLSHSGEDFSIQFIPELEIPLEESAELAHQLSFTHTQRKGYERIFSDNPDARVLECAGDLPLFFNIDKACDFAQGSEDFVMNFNAVQLMQRVLQGFNRNGYDHLINSKGVATTIKENNVFVQTRQSFEATQELIAKLYSHRNGGAYVQLLREYAPMIWNALGAKDLLALARYAYPRMRTKKAPETPLDIGIVTRLAQAVMGCSVRLDATNYLVTTCRDVDALHDYVFYKGFCERFNMQAHHPYWDHVLSLEEELRSREDVLTTQQFTSAFNNYVQQINIHTQDHAYVGSRGLQDVCFPRLEWQLDENAMLRGRVPEEEYFAFSRYLAGIELPLLQRA